MDTIDNVNGSCLCGAVKLQVKKVAKAIGACHCGMCRKWSGGALFAADCGDQVSFEGNENVSVFKSSDWAERGFCSQCGTHLFYRLKHNNEYHIPAGVLDQDITYNFNQQIFIDKKPAWYDFANDTDNLTEQQVVTKYAPES